MPVECAIRSIVAYLSQQGAFCVKLKKKEAALESVNTSLLRTAEAQTRFAWDIERWRAKRRWMRCGPFVGQGNPLALACHRSNTGKSLAYVLWSAAGYGFLN